MSRRLLDEIGKRRLKHHELFFNEIMLNTLAHKANLNVVKEARLDGKGFQCSGRTMVSSSEEHGGAPTDVATYSQSSAYAVNESL